MGTAQLRGSAADVGRLQAAWANTKGRVGCARWFISVRRVGLGMLGRVGPVEVENPLLANVVICISVQMPPHSRS